MVFGKCGVRSLLGIVESRRRGTEEEYLCFRWGRKKTQPSVSSVIHIRPLRWLVMLERDRLEPTSVRAGTGVVKVSRCKDAANGWAAEGSWFHSRQGKEIFIYSKTSGQALGPTQPSIQWAPEDLTTG
jgi:hypothetical protein